MKRFLAILLLTLGVATFATSSSSASSQSDVLYASSSGLSWARLYGKVGGQTISTMYIEGRSGYYYTGGARRSLKVISYGGGKLEMKAYLNGSYIGAFSGRYTTFAGHISEYHGTFYGNRGGILKFHLYDDTN